MANTSNLKAAEQVIKDNIRPNGTQSITADVLKSVLLDVTEAALMDITNAEIASSTMTENYVFGTDNYGERTVTGEKIARGTVTGENITDETIEASELAANSVVTTKIKDGNVTHIKLAEGSVWTNNLLSGSVTNDKLADDSVATENIIDHNVTNDKLAEDSVGTTNIINESVTVGKLAANSVGTSKIINYSVTNEKMAQNSIVTANIVSGSVTNEKLAEDAVATENIIDKNVTRIKLEDEVTDYLLTEGMKTYLQRKMQEELQEEAQAKFHGTTTSGGTTTFVYGEILPANAKKTVSVNLTFDGAAVTANTTPSGWSLDGFTYSYLLSVNGTASVGATTFNHTINSGIYQGITVTYRSTSGSVQWKYPIYEGFMVSNDISLITKNTVSLLNYHTSDVSLSNQTLVNDRSTNAYYCVLTRGTASVTQLGGTSMVDSPKSGFTFESTKISGITMTGYKAYFSNIPIPSGGSFGNVSINITQ